MTYFHFAKQKANASHESVEAKVHQMNEKLTTVSVKSSWWQKGKTLFSSNLSFTQISLILRLLATEKKEKTQNFL